MIKTLFLLLAALIVVLMSNVYVGGAEEPDPRILWVADSSIGIIHGFAVHPNGNVFAYRNNSIFEIDGKTGKIIKGYPIFSDSLKTQKINTLVLSDDGRYMAVEGIYLYDFQEEKISKININNTTFVLEFLPNSHKIANAIGGTENKTHSILVYDIDNNQTIQSTVIEEMIYNIAFSPDGKYMATAGVKEKSDGHYYTVFKLWDANKLTFIKELKRYDNSNNSQNIIKFSPDSKTLCINSSADLLFFELNNYSFMKSIFKAGFYEFINDSLMVYNDLNKGKMKILNYKDNIDKVEIGNYYTSINLKYSEINKSIVFDYFKESEEGQFFMNLICFDFDKVMSVSDNPLLIDSLMIKYEKGNISIMNIPNVYSNCNMNIVDLNGKILFEQLINNNNLEIINIKLNLLPGIYFLNLSHNTNSKTFKFLVME